ncbi:Isoprenylcysteine carboxyl methyltransferase family-domain-containing protein [Absidia repens]|uniref:Protein-S-isoprenylcysteine O-methyltransferase n=1 Tax=Absidia repens TaxID=90262 RepID=A0A1X2IEI1_9FUNG|nr:Isoprenylcysteine carboxyl methyltransferase family-domain-containing protein [Absidia repens]
MTRTSSIDSDDRILRSRFEVDELAEYHEFQEQRRKAKLSVGRILDGENTPQNIALYGFLLGLICGGGLIYALVSGTSWPPQLGYFLCALSLFHFLEYLATAMFNPDKLSLDSFLINHSAHYHAAHAATLIEFIIEYYFFGNWKTISFINYIGLALVISGQIVRTAAMFSARHNFSHYIMDYKEPDHQLVQHGIYSLMRHPSYFGFYWWAIGAQCLLLNPLCFGLVIYWLHRFFSERIAYEEHTLQRFFGDEWKLYKSRTPTGLPFIQ